jgi:hypothetical protein
MVCGGVDDLLSPLPLAGEGMVGVGRTPILGPVAWIERSEIRERPVNTAKPPRVSLALNPGYGPELVDRLSLPASGEREKKSPPC